MHVAKAGTMSAQKLGQLPHVLLLATAMQHETSCSMRQDNSMVVDCTQPQTPPHQRSTPKHGVDASKSLVIAAGGCMQDRHAQKTFVNF